MRCYPPTKDLYLLQTWLKCRASGLMKTTIFCEKKSAWSEMPKNVLNLISLHFSNPLKGWYPGGDATIGTNCKLAFLSGRWQQLPSTSSVAAVAISTTRTRPRSNTNGRSGWNFLQRPDAGGAPNWPTGAFSLLMAVVNFGWRQDMAKKFKEFLRTFHHKDEFKYRDQLRDDRSLDIDLEDLASYDEVCFFSCSFSIFRRRRWCERSRKSRPPTCHWCHFQNERTSYKMNSQFENAAKDVLYQIIVPKPDSIDELPEIQIRLCCTARPITLRALTVFFTCCLSPLIFAALQGCSYVQTCGSDWNRDLGL